MKFEILGQDIRIDQRLTEIVKDKLATCIDRYGSRINRMTITLYDVDGPRGGVDKRCRIMFTLAGQGQSSVEGSGHTWQIALSKAAERAESAITKRMKRQRSQHTIRRRRSQQVLWADYELALAESNPVTT